MIMGLKLYNTLTRRLEEFKPIGDVVGVYTCGVTVQGPPHLGHIRAAMTRDILLRWLKSLGYKVKSIENFTDVDDKIIKKQEELATDWRIIAQKNINSYLDVCRNLNILAPDYYPRASQHIAEIIQLIEKLIEKGFAYQRNGDVYYRVRKFPNYGKLSKKSIDELKAGARIEPGELKEDPLDFALWKSAKKGEPFWLSPWGRGRPGWHIECSAMSMHYLGESFDIHTGGDDLIFPHHENEIAQSEGASGKEFVHYWLHHGMVKLTGEKMAKSTGHYFLIEDILKDFSANVVRLFLMKTHYRTPIDFSRERLEEARFAYMRIRTYLDGHRESGKEIEPLMWEDFKGAMNDDLNTPKALAIIFELVNKGYQSDSVEIFSSIKRYLSILGFKEEGRGDDVSTKLMEIILEMRNQLRRKRDYELADGIRKRLNELGIIVDDAKDSSIYRWEVK